MTEEAAIDVRSAMKASEAADVTGSYIAYAIDTWCHFVFPFFIMLLCVTFNFIYIVMIPRAFQKEEIEKRQGNGSFQQ